MTLSSRLYWTGLSPRLLCLTLLCVMLCEMFIFAPSVARFRHQYLTDMMGNAHLTVMAARSVKEYDTALQEQNQNRISDVQSILSNLMMNTIGVLHVYIKQNIPETHAQLAMMGNPEHHKVQAHYDLTHTTPWHLIPDALTALIRHEKRQIRVSGPSPHDPLTHVTILIDEYPMIVKMQAYGWRILLLSLVIASITALLVFLTLQTFMVKPIRTLSQAMVDFRKEPENPQKCIKASERQDEIGLAEREMRLMQHDVQSLLHEKARLAALGSAVTKIHHDLRNILSVAMLNSDPLTLHSDPKVQKFADSLVNSLERATLLCSQTMKYAQYGTPDIQKSTLFLSKIVHDTGINLNPNGMEEQLPRPGWHSHIPENQVIWADREHLMRILDNLGRNAYQAGATQISLSCHPDATDTHTNRIILQICDNGPGLPPRALDNLFRPFAGSAKAGGTGLGLPTALELARLMGGNLSLKTSCEDGTCFELVLPVSKQPSA